MPAVSVIPFSLLTALRIRPPRGPASAHLRVRSPPIASTAQDHSAQALPAQDLPWLGELEERLDAYRARRGGDFPPRRSRQDAAATFSVEHVAKAAEVRAVAKPSPANFQSQLPFAEPHSSTAVEIAEPPSTDSPDHFSFTIAIGRYSPPPERRDGSVEIDVSIPPAQQAESDSDTGESRSKHYGLYPVASLEVRRWAALIDVFCLLFAYGGFLMLFGSLGGQFTLSKLSAEVYAATLAIVYLQYFALFTVFGGTTPGMVPRIAGVQFLRRIADSAADVAAQPWLCDLRKHHVHWLRMGLVG